ncbi:hypothetical protein BD310DRAFT_33710 [Dichomitus squalens]|uniref:Uncharacterized protein n=1 Tax=Dichomitus squalens TaxID=114155 RepID=A0A4Q9QEZ8_9APHY|nr:hypothetical protein BD310DRAFT_33710 [Dichomitus squalens]
MCIGAWMAWVPGGFGRTGPDCRLLRRLRSLGLRILLRCTSLVVARPGYRTLARMSRMRHTITTTLHSLHTRHSQNDVRRWVRGTRDNKTRQHIELTTKRN